jgi:CBS domain-containing protein
VSGQVLVRDVMNKEVLKVSPETSIIEASRLMADNHIGSLVVARRKKIMGIITERDILVGVSEFGNDISGKSVADLMTNYVITIGKSSNISKAIELMRGNKIKKLVVVEGALLRGIITATDIIVAQPELVKELSAVILKRKRR